MKIIALPDLHGAIKFLEPITTTLSSADLIILVGDLTNDGKATDAAIVVNAIRRFNTSILAIPGNWDGAPIDAYLTQEDINIHRRNTTLDGITFMGVGAALRSSYTYSPNEITEAAFKIFLEEARLNINETLPHVLVCHQPPFQTITDNAGANLHVGSQEVRAFIERTQPALCFTGHVHEAVGIDTIGKTKIINPGPIWQGRYAYAEIANNEIVTLEIRKA